jgi:hypothetical protein
MIIFPVAGFQVRSTVLATQLDSKPQRAGRPDFT